jgi:hypothetical protein
MKYEILEMLKRGGGAIVNNGSVLGLVGMAGSGQQCRQQARRKWSHEVRSAAIYHPRNSSERRGA